MAKKIPVGLFSCISILSLFFSSCVTVSGDLRAGVTGGTARVMPEWVRDPYTRYDRQAYIAERGSGNSREAAESSAYGNLAAFFGQSVQLEQRVTESYQEAVRGGVTAGWSVNTDVDTMVARSAGLDNLIGAEIGGVWDNGYEYYAVAILNKARATQIYSDIIKSNQGMIDNLLTIPQAERETLDGYARYRFAATVADMTMPYVHMISVMGGQAVQGFKRGDDYRLEARYITQAIPVGISVRNDRSGRIEGAFAKAFSDLGFRSGGSNSRYVLDANIVTSPVNLSGNQNVFTRIELKANLTDTMFRTVLMPYDFNSREGHLTQSEADNRAYAAAERRVNEEYAKLLDAYLSGLLPRR